MTRPVSVRGGAWSISADFAQLEALARLCSNLRSALVRVAGRALATHAHPALLATSALDPVGAVEVTDLLHLVAGACGAAAVAAEELSAGLRIAAAAYEESDRIIARAVPAVRALTELPSAVLAFDPGAPVRSLDRFVVEDPEVASLGVDAVTADFPGGYLLGTRRLTGGVASQFPDGHPVVRQDLAALVADEPPPRSLADLMRGLDLRNRQSSGGAIDVRILTSYAPDGRSVRRAVVDITGTTDWSPAPRSAIVTNLGTNLHALAGDVTTYGAGIAEAMSQAGVTPDMPVMLVGHSQGGIVAVDMARHYRERGEFNITHVVTAGAPVGLLDVPDDVQVLSIENRGDVVPHADGALNPARPNRLTVGIDRGGTDVGDRHDITDAYLPGAADIDASTHLGVRTWLQSAAGFLDAEEVHTTAFTVSRGY
jgi:hypothetical protein